MRREFTYFKKQLVREWLIFQRQPRIILNSALFFIMISVFFPLLMPPDVQILRQIAPGLVWMGSLLSMLLASERLFQQDYEDGILEQYLLSGYSLSLIIVAKLAVHWLLLLLPLLLFSPFIALLFGFSTHETLILIATLILGTPFLVTLCALAAAFSTGMQQKGVFMALILFPLTIPVIVFGSGAVVSAMQGFNALPYLAILAALSLLASAFLPFVITVVIRISHAD